MLEILYNFGYVYWSMLKFDYRLLYALRMRKYEERICWGDFLVGRVFWKMFLGIINFECLLCLYY